MLRPRLVKIAAAVVAGSLLSVPSGSNAQSISVKYRPYELYSDAGMRAVLHRIERAAKRACDDGGAAPLGRPVCARELTGQVVEKIDHRPMIALWRNDNPSIRLASRAR